jgi:trehalose utilization protein
MALPRLLVWNEYRHELQNPEVSAVYPDGIHEAIADPLRQRGFPVATATLDQPEHGLTDEVLNRTDVLLWWGHKAHEEVSDAVVERVRRHVMGGLGLIVLHSGHYSKIFRRLMGTSCSVNWRVHGKAGETERIWVTAPAHPIAAGLDRYIELPQEEMYGEFFDVPEPDELVFVSWFKGGEVFRSGLSYRRGHGRIFYFRPGHETFPSYHNAEVQKVIANAASWAAQPGVRRTPPDNMRREPIEAIG